MKTFSKRSKISLIGRVAERSELTTIANSGKASIIITYGRRRIGKTELLEQTFIKRQLLKFEGLENKPQAEQIQHVLWQLSQYAGDPLIAKLNFSTWVEVLDLIANFIEQGEWTLYLEELQWLANYQSELIAALKFVWDNRLRYNNKLVVILCGSSPSFMLSHVVRSRALYNRSEHVFSLKEFTIKEAGEMLAGKSNREVMDAYLCVGGIPEYLKRLHSKSSIFLSLCDNSFKSNSFLANEYEKIFTSHLADNPHYKKIIAYLAKRKFATRNDLLKSLKLKSGGHLTNLLTDLEECGFIQHYAPYNLGGNSRLSRYCITDNYLQFFFKFIQPISSHIKSADYDKNPTEAINISQWQRWLGFAFERYCRKYHKVIAKILGFSAVKYRSGTFFNKATNSEDPGYQIDLLFDRDDKVITLCEIKYLQAKASRKVVEEFEQKLMLFKTNKTIQKVLISASGAETSVTDHGYFDRIITLDELCQHDS